MIGRVLEYHGFKVGIIPQPDWRDKNSFKILGRPRLFGITSGSVDSMVANCTPNKLRRKEDAYTHQELMVKGLIEQLLYMLM